MKKLKHIINWTIWSLLALYIFIIVLLHLPFVQSWIGQQVAGVLSSKIGTTVSVGRVDVGFLNRLIIDDVTINDQQNSEMIKAGRMSVKIDVLALMDGRVSISSAQLFGAQLTLRRDSAGATPNYQFLLDSLASGDNDRKKSVDVRLNSLIIRNSAVSYDQLDADDPPHQLNPRHIAVRDISAHIVLKALTDDSLNLSIKRLAFKEQSGLDVKKMALKVEANRERALLTGLSLQMPHSILYMDTLATTYDIDRLTETLSYEGRVANSVLMPSDLKSLWPPLQDFNHHLAVDLAFSGTANAISCPKISIISDDKAVVLQAAAEVSDIGGDMTVDGTVSDMYLGQPLLIELQKNIDGMPGMISRLDFVSMNGSISSQRDVIRTQSSINTGTGNLQFNGTYAPALGEFNGHLVTDSLDIGLLTADRRLGHLSTSVDIAGNDRQMAVQGTVATVTYNGYSYHNIDINGNYADGNISGRLTVDDPNIFADIEGMLAHDSRYTLQMTGTIDHLAPKALHLSDHWGDAAFSAIVNANFTASSLADAEGELNLRRFEMTAPDSLSYPYYLDHLTIRSGFDNEQHFISLDGDFGDAELRGNFDLQTLPQSFVNYTASRLPTLPGLPATTRPTANDFNVNMHLVNSDWIQQLIGIPLNLNNSPLTLYAEVSDRNNDLDIKGTLPEFTYKDSPYKNGFIHIATHSDSTVCSLNLTKILKDDRKLDLQLTALASNNNVVSRLTFDNSDLSGDSARSMYGTVNTIAQLYTNDNGKPEAHIRVMPSRIMLKGTAWTMEPSDILYADKQLLVDHFTVRHGQQHLIIDGLATDHSDDSLMVDLNDLEVGYLLELVSFRSVKFAGPATGKAYITSLFGDTKAWADISIDDFLFQDGHMGALNAHTEWDSDEQRVNIDAAIATVNNDSTFVNGYISPKDKELDLAITAQGSPISFVHSFLKSFISDINGHANGMLRVHGPLSQLLMTGDMAVDGRAAFTPLGTSYTMSNDTVHFLPDGIVFDHFQVFDRDGRTATLNGTVSHRHLKHFTYRLNVDADRTLVYDFPTFNGGTICGTVYADGHATINGKPGEVVIDCDITPAPSSVFAYNAATPDAINRQQFITWGAATPSGNQPTAAPRAAQQTAAKTATDTSGDVYINFRINASPDATLRFLMDQNSGDQINLNGNGMLRASYHNKGPFQMFGTYNVERGTYSMTIQNIIKKNFTFQQGSTIVFSGDPFSASLNLKATHTVNGVSLSDLNIGNSFTRNTIRVNCLMNILGTAGTPRVEFDLEMPTVNNEEEQMIRSIIASEQELNQQVVYLLGIGRFYTQGSNNAGTQSYGQTELAMQSLLSGTVSSQINEILSQVIKNDDWNFGANISTGNEGWHNAEYEGLVSGRMLNNRLIINGQFGYRNNATTTAPSFIGDFDISYLLLPNGNVSLKVYNQTNDRYFTHSSLNTQGIGLVMKKDFNSLRELFHSQRKKNKN